ncbi:hypothetical protein XENOCAPTIV_009421 [Xenoophorus captivus]|uniref:Uncharacterized protein n=1 Tax=Xenoophorus captivus TaxID=1517983 RepID=A0ABV0QRR0_9TELE
MLGLNTSEPSGSGPDQSPAPSGSAVSKGEIYNDFNIQVLSGQRHWPAASDVFIEVCCTLPSPEQTSSEIPGNYCHFCAGRKCFEQKTEQTKGENSKYAPVP